MKASPDVRFTSTPDGGVLLDLRSDRFFTLNQTGARLWSLFLEGRPRPDIVRSLAWHTGVEQATAAADVEEFVAELVVRNLLQREEENPR